MHLKLKSHENLFIHNTNFLSQIVLKICTGHSRDTTMLCAKLQNNMTSEQNVMDKLVFMTFAFKAHFGQISYIATVPWTMTVFNHTCILPWDTITAAMVIHNHSCHKDFSVWREIQTLPPRCVGEICSKYLPNEPCMPTKQSKTCRLRWIHNMADVYLMFLSPSIHWDLNKMATILQTKISNAFSLMEITAVWLKFHWALFPRVQLALNQQWFR